MGFVAITTTEGGGAGGPVKGVRLIGAFVSGGEDCQSFSGRPVPAKEEVGGGQTLARAT